MSHLHHKISALVDGELHGSARRRAVDHTRHCADCRHELEATLALKRRMAGLSATEPPPDLFASLDGLPRRRLGECSTSAPHRAKLAPVVRKVLVGAGSLSVVVLSLAYVVGAPGETPAERVTPPVDEYTAEFAGDTGLAPLADPAVGALPGDIRPVAQVVSQGGAETVPTSSPISLSTGDDLDAVHALERAVSAPDRVAYEGIRQVQTFDTQPAATLRLEVQHVPGQGTSFDVANGSWHDSTATFVAQREAAAPASLSSAPLDLLLDAYDLSVVSSATILGRSATVIAASRDGVASAEFWVDDQTGLLLRRETYDAGRITRSSGFTELRVTRGAFLRHLPPELEVPPATTLAMTSAPVLNDDGWTCPGALKADFTLTRLDSLQTAGDVMRASYSDGLSSLSLFEQRGRLDASALNGFTPTTMGADEVFVRYGLPTVAVWESADTVYTVVTDASHAVSTTVISGLPHPSPVTSGMSERLVSGLRRIGSFVDPGH